MTEEMKTTMEDLSKNFATTIVKVNETLKVCHVDSYDVKVYEEGFAVAISIMQAKYDKLLAAGKILNRYHGGDGTVTRRDVMKALTKLNPLGDTDDIA